MEYNWMYLITIFPILFLFYSILVPIKYKKGREFYRKYNDYDRKLNLLKKYNEICRNNLFFLTDSQKRRVRYGLSISFQRSYLLSSGHDIDIDEEIGRISKDLLWCENLINIPHFKIKNREKIIKELKI